MKKIALPWQKACLLLLLTIASLNLLSQHIPKVIPPSPNAANLGSYVGTPMGHYTGTPSISIPIWTITEGKLSLPISLSYKSGGIRVSEIASSTGLGWVLNAGGSITRSVVGLPDETPSAGYLNARLPYVLNDHTYASGIASGATDGQQDIFFYSLPNYDGRFVFDKQQAIHTIPRQNIKIQPGPTAHLSFFNGSFTQFTTWTVTDDKGVTYKFDAYEKTSNVGFSSIDYSVNTWYLTEMMAPTGEKITFNYENYDLDYHLPGTRTDWILINGSSEFLMPSSNSGQAHIVNAKRLSSIEFTNGKIEFIAASYGRADLLGDKAMEKIVIKDKVGNIVKQFRLHYQYLIGTSMVPYNSVTYSGETNHITTSNEQFLYGCFRRRLMLQKIVEEDKNGVALNSGFQLDYIHNYPMPNRATQVFDHWGFANNSDDPFNPRPAFVNVNMQYYLTFKGANPIYAQQGSLYKVTYPTGGYTEYEYEPNIVAAGPSTPTEYITGNLATLPFSHGSYLTQESFEYEERTFNGFTSRHYYVPFTLNLANSQVAITIANIPHNYEDYGFYIENVNDPNDPIWGYSHNTTQQITLPAGNYRLYHRPSPYILGNQNHPDYFALYDCTVFGTFAYSPPVEGGTLAGGIRVKKLTQYDPVANNTITKLYTYEMDGSSGHTLNKPEYVYSYEITNAAPNVNWQEYKVCTRGSIYPLSTTHGSYVGYEHVEEKTVSQDGTPLGKTEYTFIAPNFEPDVMFTNNGSMTNPYWGEEVFPNPPVDNRDWLRGFLVDQRDYKYTNNAYQEVRRVENAYTKSVVPVSPGVKMDVFGYSFANGGHYTFAMNFYNIYSGFIYPGESKETLFNGSESITTRTLTVNSETCFLPVKQTSFNSNGTVTHTYTTYPKEYPAGTPFIDALITKNIVSVPIEQVKAHEPTTGVINILDGVINTYRTDNWLADAEYHFENSGALPLASFKFSNMNTGQLPASTGQQLYLPDSRYKMRLKYNAYDDKGNLTEVQKTDDLMNAFIWGYDKTLPIAQATNTLAKDIFYTSFEDAEGNSTPDDSKTGRKSRTGGYSKSLTGLTNGNYRLSYWQKSGSAWNLQSNTVSVSGGNYSIDLSGQVDEVRFHPLNAQMATYTYEPLVGMTSSADPRNYISYYEYDNFIRLLRIRDEDRNILKQYQYQFTAYDHSNALWEGTGNMRCQPCAANAAYTTNMRQIEEKDINPASATYNQLRWTNVGTTCFISPDWQGTGNFRCVKNASNNNTGEQEREERDLNPCSPTYNQLRWYSLGQNLTACPLPSNCTPSNCSGADKKCVNGVCETGVKVYFGGIQIGPNLYQCTYRYQFSDGSLSSQSFTENHTTPCPNDFEG